MFAGQFAGYWRDGKRVAMDRNAALPDRCFKCNEPANGYRRTVKLTHVPLGTEMMVGAIAYAFAKRATLEVGLCERHRRSRAINAALISLAVIGLSILVFTQVHATDVVLPLLATAGLIGGVVGLIYAAVGTRVVRATKITDTHVWLKGAGEAFLASLPDAPVVGAGGALPTLDAAAVPADPAASAQVAFRDARNGALAFLVGCIVTAGSYALLPGRYFIAWGAVIYGLIRLFRGARTYVSTPAEHRNMGHALMLVAIVGAGLVTGGWVIASEVTAQTEASQFDGALTTAGHYQTQGATLFRDVMNRTDAWTTQDSADMRKVASSYGQAADALAASSPPSDYGWYRDGLVRNYREAVDIATQFSNLTSSSSRSTFDALVARWTARVKDLSQLQARLDTKPNRSP
ncbi:MAG: hypothetical protein E6J23_10010 [Chloroflexi bacterium]|nr:MAG: hypothetical protein E6J23_10010 [Chloroflexota bacterium]